MDIINNYNNLKLINSDYYAKIEAFYVKEYTNFITKTHAHTHIEIMYITKGTCTIIINNKTFHMKKDEFVIINRSIFHKLIISNIPCKIINLEFQFTDKCDNCCSIGSIIKYSSFIQSLINSNSDYFYLKNLYNVDSIMKHIIESQYYNGNSNDNDHNLIVQLKMAELLMTISQLINISNIDMVHNSIAYVKQAIEYINLNYANQIKIEDIASYINIHPTYLQKLFKKEMNCTIINYLTNVRIEKSKHYLTDTDYLITDIPSYIGMNSVQYYINVFKKITLSTPQQYRDSHSIFFHDENYSKSIISVNDYTTNKKYNN